MRARVATLALAAVLTLSACGDEEGSTAAGPSCATKELYGRTLEIRVVGKPVPCSEVRRVVAGPCRDGKKWSCFSFWPPGPVLLWFLERERFRPGPDSFSTAIEAPRWPCREARVTRAAWARAKRDDPDLFPHPQQVLADDIVRCKLLRGMTRAQVVRLLGRDEGSAEFLSIEFDRRGIFKKADFSQG